jgi:hypothetical protein
MAGAAEIADYRSDTARPDRRSHHVARRDPDALRKSSRRFRSTALLAAYFQVFFLQHCPLTASARVSNRRPTMISAFSTNCASTPNSPLYFDSQANDLCPSCPMSRPTSLGTFQPGVVI